jgi:excisionase family DNA binding protein
MSKKKKTTKSAATSRQDRLALLEARVQAMTKEIHKMRERMMEIEQQASLGHNVMLTTQEAAEFIGSSRPYVIKLIEEGKLPCEMVGTHRRISIEALNRYKEERRIRERKGLLELQKLEQELGI